VQAVRSARSQEKSHAAVSEPGALLTEEIRTSLQLIADLIPSKDEGQARSRAILTCSALVGAIGLARALSDEALSREILKSVSELLKKTVGDDGENEFQQ
jgi:hypothetical protein